MWGMVWGGMDFLMIDYSGVDEVIEEVRRLGGAERIAEANARMGEGVRGWLMEWYLERAESGHFENPGLPTHGAGRNKTGWANEVALESAGLYRRPAVRILEHSVDQNGNVEQIPINHPELPLW